MTDLEIFDQQKRLLLRLVEATSKGDELAQKIINEWCAYVADYEGTFGDNLPLGDKYLLVCAQRLGWPRP